MLKNHDHLEKGSEYQDKGLLSLCIHCTFQALWRKGHKLHFISKSYSLEPLPEAGSPLREFLLFLLAFISH